MPALTSTRRLGAVTALYAVFLAGWWLGKPVLSQGCFEEEPTAGAGGRPASMEPAAPSRYFGNFDLDFGLLDHLDGMDGRVDGEYGPSDYAYAYDPRVGEDTSAAGHALCVHRKRARLLAWINGDWG